MESIPELSMGEKDDNIQDVPGKGDELAIHFGNAMEVDVDKGYLEEWNAPVLIKVIPQRGGPVRKERNDFSHMKRNHRNGKFTCDECGIPVKREVMNEWHMQSAHVLGRIVCDRCGIMSGGLDGKGRHVGRVHGKPPVDLGQRVRIPYPRAGIRPLPSSCPAPCPPPGSSPVQS